MKTHVLIVSLLFAALAPVHAQDLTPKQQYAAESKRASIRYADDKKLCSEESSSSARMQCLRDAKTEYDKSLAGAKAAMNAAMNSNQHRPGQNEPAGICRDCGKVIAVNVSEKDGEGSPLGLIAGGVAGAVLGHQVGGGTGRDLATIAGAAGGAYAGRKVEQKVKSSKVWAVTVQYEDGNKASFNFDHDPGLQSGDRVRNSGNSIIRR
ncbi:glycine zipper 2TM domain-containing protein [Undibacterium sp.]|uniref:glycine zipper 2TM domain-containing protein n=1 Tax=Undibacterium sp. TaxID=1914977 RepID=UPI00374D93BC